MNASGLGATPHPAKVVVEKLLAAISEFSLVPGLEWK
jgi:hypothetical protein